METRQNTRGMGRRDISKVEKRTTSASVGDVHHSLQVAGMVMRVRNDRNQHC